LKRSNHPFAKSPFQANPNQSLLRRMDAYAVTPYVPHAELYADPTLILGVFATLALLHMTHPSESSETEDLQKQLEMAHKHQEVLEQDIENLQSSLANMVNTAPASKKESVEDVITNLLQNKPSGMKCKDILKMMLPVMPNLTKPDLNSILYKMKSKNLLQNKKSADTAPIWIVAK